MKSISPLDYRNRVSDIVVEADQLLSILNLFEITYFACAPDGNGAPGENANWFTMNYEEMMNIVGGISTLCARQRDMLRELEETKIGGGDEE